MAGELKTMPTSPLSKVIQHLLADLRPDGGGMTDGELLARFVRSRSGAEARPDGVGRLPPPPPPPRR
jgi:hypothetical protein